MPTQAITYDVAGYISRVFGSLSDIYNSLQHSRHVQETRRTLAGLSDAQLKDIGINRGEIARLR